MQIIMSDLMRAVQNPVTLRDLCQDSGNRLTGLERWLSLKLGFKVEIFTDVQKEWLTCKHNEKSYTMDGKLIVGPLTYELIEKTIWRESKKQKIKGFI